MLRQEFVERTGFEPTEKEYNEIEAEYMGCDMDKDEFCKSWKKQGGAHRLMRRRARKIEELEVEMFMAKKACSEMETLCIRQLEDMRRNKSAAIQRKEERIEELKDLLDKSETKAVEAEERARKAEEQLNLIKAAFALLIGKDV